MRQLGAFTMIAMLGCAGACRGKVEALPTMDSSIRAIDSSTRIDAAVQADEGGTPPIAPDSGDPDMDAGDPGKDAEIRAEDLPFRAEVGVVDTTTLLDYMDLPPGGTIPIGGTGQAGLTARMAVKVFDPEGKMDLDHAVLSLVLTRIDNGVIAESKNFGQAVDLSCSAGVCYRVPVLVEISHVAKLPELEGTEVAADLWIYSASDPGVPLARADSWGVFQRF